MGVMLRKYRSRAYTTASLSAFFAAATASSRQLSGSAVRSAAVAKYCWAVAGAALSSSMTPIRWYRSPLTGSAVRIRRRPVAIWPSRPNWVPAR